MRVFKNFNQTTNCPICKTNAGGEATLISKDGTEKDGIEEAEQVHVGCLRLRIANGPGVRYIYQVIVP